MKDRLQSKRIAIRVQRLYGWNQCCSGGYIMILITAQLFVIISQWYIKTAAERKAEYIVHVLYTISMLDNICAHLKDEFVYNKALNECIF